MEQILGLRTFILSEEVKVSHAERYLGYVERYHSQVFLDLKRKLETVWGSEVAKLSKLHPISAEALQDMLLRNPKATTELKLVTTPEKLVTARAREPLEVSPSIKVPFVYATHERHLLTKQILGSTKSAMEDIAESWKEVFNYEHKGKLTPWFKVLSDPDEVRFQLSLGTGQSESFKTLYTVRVEYGKSSSKLKDFDRIYLVSIV